MINIGRCPNCHQFGEMHEWPTDCPETIPVTLLSESYGVIRKDLPVDIRKMHPWPGVIVYEGMAYVYQEVDDDVRTMNNNYEYEFRSHGPTLVVDWLFIPVKNTPSRSQ